MPEEFLDIVDEEDNITGNTTRKNVREKFLLHRVATIIIINNKGEFLTLKRSKSKDIFPGYWGLGVAETVKSGENYEEAAARGLNEEIGYPTSTMELKHAFQFNLKYRSGKHNVNYKVFKVFCNAELNLQREEVEEGKFISKDEIKKLIEAENFHPGSAQIFYNYIKNKQLE